MQSPDNGRWAFNNGIRAWPWHKDHNPLVIVNPQILPASGSIPGILSYILTGSGFLWSMWYKQYASAVLTRLWVVIFGHRTFMDQIILWQTWKALLQAGTGLAVLILIFLILKRLIFSGYSGCNIIEWEDIVTSPAHYITRLHVNDSYHPTNNKISLRLLTGDTPATITLSQSDFTLSGGITLATMTNGSDTAPLLQVASSGAGRIVKWTSYNWMFDEPLVLGPAFGMDDLIWRGIVQAAERKPLSCRDFHRWLPWGWWCWRDTLHGEQGKADLQESQVVEDQQ